MPGKKEKKKAGHFMSYFRHKLLYLKDACKKRKRKKQATLCHNLDINYCIQKMPGKKENKNRPCHILDINYCI